VKICREGRPFMVELRPGNANHPESCRAQGAIARTVGLKRVLGVMEGAPVELDDQALPTP